MSEKLIRALLSKGAAVLAPVVPDIAELRIENRFARPFIQALKPFAVSSRLWRTGRLLTPRALYADAANPVHAAALRMSGRSTTRGASWPRSVGDLQLLHRDIVFAGKNIHDKCNSDLRRVAVNVGSSGVSFPAPRKVCELTELAAKYIFRRSVGISDALAFALAILLIHPFEDGNGRLARSALTLLGKRAIGDWHVPLPIPFVMQSGQTLLRELSIAANGGGVASLLPIFSRSTRSQLAFTAELRSWIAQYEFECASGLGAKNDRTTLLFSCSLALSDDAFTKGVGRLTVNQKRFVENSMYSAVLGEIGVMWVNNICLQKMDGVCPWLYKLL